MDEPEDLAALNVLLNGIPCDRGLVVLVDDEGNIQTGDKNLGPENVMLVCFSLAAQIAQDLKSSGKYPDSSMDIPRQKTRPMIYLPPDLQRKLDQL